ncbi:MAG: PAS domain-containing protein [Pseudomonadales bacterium]|nr:PAS domain-containing protein [Pseudomonadales bacterium]
MDTEKKLPLFNKIIVIMAITLLSLSLIIMVQMGQIADISSDKQWQSHQLSYFYLPLLSTLVIITAALLGIVKVKKGSEAAIDKTIQDSLIACEELDKNDIVLYAHDKIQQLMQLVKTLTQHATSSPPSPIAALKDCDIAAVLHACPASIVVMDNSHNICFTNTAAQNLINAHQLNNAELATDLTQLIQSTAAEKTLELGNKTFQIHSKTLYDDQQQVIAYIIEWQDKSAEKLKDQTIEKNSLFNAQIKNTLDDCHSNIMLADKDNNIIYLNHAVKTMMKEAEQDIAQSLPGFKSADILGSNIDIFHKMPNHQQKILADLKDVIESDIAIAGHIFHLSSTPLFDEHKTRIGTAVEWIDKTQTIKHQQELDRQLQENLQLSNALNNVVGNVMLLDQEHKIIFINKVLQNTLNKGQSDLAKEIPGFNAKNMLGYSADDLHQNLCGFDDIINGLIERKETAAMIGGRYMRLYLTPIFDNTTRVGTVIEWKDDTLQIRMQEEIDNIVAAAANGDLSKRIDEKGKNAFYEKLSVGINHFLSLTEEFISDIGCTIGAMSEGDLTQPITSDYIGEFERIKDITNQNLTTLSTVLTKISELSSTVSSDTREISAGNLDLSRRTEQQAASLEETAASMEEMTSTIVQNTESSKNAADLAQKTSAIAAAGGDVVNKAISAMGTISESSNKIADIISVIDEIAFQTNLLALNASVEAARAGEQGRGFAVVAGEVRNLAGRSATAAKEIKELIEDSVHKVDEGKQLVNKSGESLTKIVDSVKEVSSLVAEIATASEEQSLGIAEVNRAITKMDEMTQQNAALVEEVASTSDVLGGKSRELNEMISFFKTI